ncbi:peptide deformylase [bacterium]|nr:MAG: peptide deformylase [bacterium]RKZ15692.1 MAG: peptide deformylase [bacterium]
MVEDLEVLLYGHPGLREKSRPVEDFDDQIASLVRRMERAMIMERGIGLAAPQVGQRLRLLLAEDSRGAGTRTLAMVNPEILSVSRETDNFSEGCLSLPELFADVKRPVEIRVRYQDVQGQEHELSDDGILARIIQHELDHLDGILFVDHLPVLKRKLLARKLRAFSDRAREQQERGI